jgi:hypothetical protein
MNKLVADRTRQLTTTTPVPSHVLQRTAINASPVHNVSPIVHEVLRSPGQPLDAATRAYMEPRFGHDFSQVRVHTDAQAAQSAAAAYALAYTVGQDLVFGAGMYEPGTAWGRRLLAHELVHTIQQQDSPQRFQSQTAVGPTTNPSEREAERVAAQVVPEAGGVEETGSEEAIEGSLPIEQQVAYRPGQDAGAVQPKPPALSQAISRINGGPHLQCLCAKSRAEAGYPVNVNLTIPATPAPDHSHSTAWISARAGDANNQTAGLAEFKAEFRYKIATRTRGDRSWVTGIRVWLQKPHIRIYITRAMARNSCEYNDLLRHERRHDADYRENVAEAEARICESGVGWPTATYSLPASVLNMAGLRIQIGDWLRLENWQILYENWLDGCAWDAVDYPRLYTSCPGSAWSAPPASCPPRPPRPAITVFPLPNK